MAIRFHTTKFYIANLKTVPILGAGYYNHPGGGGVTNLGCKAYGDVPTYSVNV